MNWDLNAALGVLITQIGGRKRKTIAISRIADAAAFAVKELGSAQRVAIEIRRASARAQINDFVAINTLPVGVKQKYVDKGLVGIEVASELSRLVSPTRIMETAKVVSGIKARDAMQIINYAKRNPRVSALAIRNKVLRSKNKSRHLDVLVIPLERSEYYALRAFALRRGKRPTDLARDIVLRWLAVHRTSRATEAKKA